MSETHKHHENGQVAENVMRQQSETAREHPVREPATARERAMLERYKKLEEELYEQDGKRPPRSDELRQLTRRLRQKGLIPSVAQDRENDRKAKSWFFGGVSDRTIRRYRKEGLPGQRDTALRAACSPEQLAQLNDIKEYGRLQDKCIAFLNGFDRASPKNQREIIEIFGVELSRAVREGWKLVRDETLK
jgi:hypothetical protein